MSLREEDDRITGDEHRGKLFPFAEGSRIRKESQSLDPRGDLRFEIEQTLVVELSVQGGVTRSPLFHELREKACVRLPSIPPETREYPLPGAAALPEGNHPLAVRLDVLIRDRVSGLGPVA